MKIQITNTELLKVLSERFGITVSEFSLAESVSSILKNFIALHPFYKGEGKIPSETLTLVKTNIKKKLMLESPATKQGNLNRRLFDEKKTFKCLKGRNQNLSHQS